METPDRPGRGGPDAEDRAQEQAQEQAVARAEWDERIAAARGELDLAEEFKAIGRSWSEVDAQGDLVVKNATGARPSPTIEDVESSWVEAVGPFYGTATVAGGLGVPVTALPALARQGSVLACQTRSGKVVYPAWQFGPGGQVLPSLLPILQILAGTDASGWLRAAWLRSPEVELGGRPPLRVLLTGGEDDLVLLVASHAAAGWA